MMNDVTKFLTDNPVQYFATTGLDGRPKVRPFQFMTEHDGKLFFCTSNQKEVFKEITQSPEVEVCVSSPSFAWLRLSGKVKFYSSKELKTKIIESSPLVKNIYHDACNPQFEIFYLENCTAVIADFSGNAPHKYTLS